MNSQVRDEQKVTKKLDPSKPLFHIRNSCRSIASYDALYRYDPGKWERVGSDRIDVLHDCVQLFPKYDGASTYGGNLYVSDIDTTQDEEEAYALLEERAQKSLQGAKNGVFNANNYLGRVQDFRKNRGC